ncbi:MAG TPA: amino acid adenylation domain-containing protein, partial [Longimicrobium sp.]|nr:amino acid adenylation domain-containing protein [Longimicrobium sp.]
GGGGGGGFTPSDFPLAGLDQAALDSLLEDLGGGSAIDGEGSGSIRAQVEDVYPLTPLQEGMLFHALHSPESGAYAEQTVLELEGDLDPEAFAGAWRAVVEATPVLRSAFDWAGLARPLQAVMRRPELPFTQLDWSGIDEEERERRWSALMEADHAAGWDLGRAPLMRFALARLGGGRWRLLFSFHHLLMDGWSMGLVLADFSAAYAALRAGRAPHLPRRAPFRDYLAWLERRDAAAAEAYWRARLAGVEDPMPLPLDRQPALAGEPAEEHAHEALLLSPALAQGVREAARRWRVTSSTVAEAAWGAVLARYTGLAEVVFGAIVSGRPPELPGVERMIGLFINTVPVRGPVPRAGAVGAWLRGWQERQSEAREHEHAPLARIRTWTAVPGDAPLFETLFVYENYPLAEEGDTPPDGFAVTAAKSSERTNYPLSLTVAPVHDGVRLSATFDSRRLDGARVRALLEAYGAVMGALARGEGDCAALDPLSAAERARVVHEWNRTDAEFPRAPAHRLFQEWAARTPHATALRLDPAETVSYAELNARANRLARRLRDLGIGRESRVGIALERSAELIVAIVAVVKAGGAYVPLDPEYPPARLAYMLRDAGASVVIARTALSVAEWAGEARVVALDGEREALAALSPENLEVEVDPEGLAYVLYTSGSTGLPKGTGVPHRAIVRLVRGQSFCRLDADEVVLQMVPVAFDVSTFEIWGPLVNGGCMAVYPPGIPEPRAVGDFVRRHGVTTAWLTVGLFHQAVDEGLPGFEGVRQLLTGGDVVSPAHAARAMEILPNARLIDGYGPTEATTFTSCHTVRPEDLLGSSIPVGAPLANARHYVLDAWMRPVPIGVAGELYIAGDGVARGYLGRPALTAEKFVPDPFSALPGGRLYRTGDRVRWTHGGIIEFLGRLDGQVKLRGFRIEPGEVEAALRSHPSVRDATSVVRGEGDQRRLLAYVVLGDVDRPGDADRSGDAATVEALKEHVAARVPAFMVPAAVVVLDSIPLTPNGKVDRRALPEPDMAAADPYEAPATATETALAVIWEELLGVPRVGAGQRFFESGGHSLLAMRMVTEIATRLGVDLPLRTVFESPRLRDLAARVDELRDQALAALLAELGIAGLGGMEGDVAQMS